MKNNYYYLVAGLPDIMLDEARGKLSFLELAQEIMEQVSEKDATMVRDLRLEFDKKEYHIASI